MKTYVALLEYRAKLLLRGVLPVFLRKRLKRIQKGRETRKLAEAKKRAVRRYGRFGPEELYDELSGVPIRRGCTLLIQSSFGRFHNFDGTAVDVLNVLNEIVGPEGTLIMPAHPHYDYKENGPYVFNANRAPAHTGLLCELFRRQPGVVRSLHPTHSVCARGPLAAKLLEDHHKDALSCGPMSPYAKLAEYSGEILGLGLPEGYTTFLHVIEDEDVESYPKRLYADKSYEYTIVGEAAESFSMSMKRRDIGTGKMMNLSRFVSNLSDACYLNFEIFGVPCFHAKATPLLKELRELTKRGILLYD